MQKAMSKRLIKECEKLGNKKLLIDSSYILSNELCFRLGAREADSKKSSKN